MKRAHLIRGAVIVLLLAIIVSKGAPVWAADTRVGDVVTIAAGTTIDDNLLATGNTITIDGTVHGDLVAAGAQVTINGTVDGNVFVAAQYLVINGTVGDDVAAATQALQLGPKAVVTRNILNFGYSFEGAPGSLVKGDFIFYGGQALVLGNIGKSVKGGMNGLELRGNVGGNVEVQVGDSANTADVGRISTGAISMPNVAPGLHIGEGAAIGGRLIYEAARQGDISPGAKVTGPVTWTQITADKSNNSGLLGAGAGEFSILAEVQRFATLLLVGLLLIWIFPKWMNRLGDAVKATPGATLGRGAILFLLFLLILILVPVATIVLALIFGLLTLGDLAWVSVVVGTLSEIGIIVAFVLFVTYIAQAVIALVLGKWLLSRFQPRLSEGNLLPLVLGLVIVVVVTAIPVVGGLLGLLITLLGLGALWRWLRPGRPTAPGPMSTPVSTPMAS